MKHGKIWCAAALALLLGASATPAQASGISFGGAPQHGGGYLAPDSSAPQHGGGYLAPGTPTSSEFVLGPTSPGKWGPPVFGTGAVVTWSLMPSGATMEPGEGLSSALSSFMPAGFLAAIQAAFDAWSAVANLTFVQLTEVGVCNFQAAGCNQGDIRIAGTNLGGAGGTLAHGYYPPSNGGLAAGDIHFDVNDGWDLVFDGTGDGAFSIFQVMAHELGHALGLDHTLVPASLMNAFYTEAFSGPQADDIAGMQFIYGPAPQDPGDPIPEPATLALLGAGLFAAAARRRAMKK